MAETLGDIRAANKAGASPAYAGLFVVYDLPDRDCAAAASNGEYSIANNGLCVSYHVSPLTLPEATSSFLRYSLDLKGR